MNALEVISEETEEALVKEEEEEAMTGKEALSGKKEAASPDDSSRLKEPMVIRMEEVFFEPTWTGDEFDFLEDVGSVKRLADVESEGWMSFCAGLAFVGLVLAIAFAVNIGSLFLDVLEWLILRLVDNAKVQPTLRDNNAAPRVGRRRTAADHHHHPKQQPVTMASK